MSKSKKINVLGALALLTTATAARAAEPAAPPPPPEVQKTVEAFTGNLVFDGSLTLPDGKPQPTKLRLDCKKTALGKGVVCAGSGTLPGLGPWQATFMIGYDTHLKVVRFMSLTSDDEIHDHRCTWKSDSALECLPLQAGMGGQPITEDLGFVVNPKMLTLKSVTTMKDGGRIAFEGTARRK
jgi:hypothetical protein